MLHGVCDNAASFAGNFLRGDLGTPEAKTRWEVENLEVGVFVRAIRGQGHGHEV